MTEHDSRPYTHAYTHARCPYKKPSDQMQRTRSCTQHESMHDILICNWSITGACALCMYMFLYVLPCLGHKVFRLSCERKTCRPTWVLDLVDLVDKIHEVRRHLAFPTPGSGCFCTYGVVTLCWGFRLHCLYFLRERGG